MASSRYERYQYIYGNTARAVEEPIPEPARQEPERKKPQPEKKRVVRSNHKVLEFNSRFTRNLTLAVAAMVVICVAYLHGQASLNEQIRTISEKRTELTSLVNENHAKQSNLNQSVDYDSIKEYAQEKLGMVVPGEKNTIYYEGTSSDYVRQYEDIPAVQ